MNHPLITIVDENDQPAGAATMNEAHQKGLIHRIVRVMVEDGQGNLLLQKRVPDATLYPGCWDNSSAGHVDEGESYEVAARRELKEEIGVDDVVLAELGYYQTHGRYKERILNRFTKTYKTVLPADTRFRLQPEEVAAVQWFTLAKAKRLAAEHPDQVTDGLIEVIERFYT
jgi:isopentenyldiphosphate isomerase